MLKLSLRFSQTLGSWREFANIYRVSGTCRDLNQAGETWGGENRRGLCLHGIHRGETDTTLLLCPFLFFVSLPRASPPLKPCIISFAGV